MFMVDDKIHSKNRCELSSVIIIIRGSCLLGACICNLDCLIDVIPQLIYIKCVRSTKCDQRC